MIANKTVLDVNKFVLHPNMLLKTAASREELFAQLDKNWIGQFSGN